MVLEIQSNKDHVLQTTYMTKVFKSGGKNNQLKKVTLLSSSLIKLSFSTISFKLASSSSKNQIGNDFG
jgi:hypothetical protein